MSIKTLVLSLSNMIYASFAFSQNTINGRLEDKDKKPIAFATVKLLNAGDSAMLGFVLSTELGYFSFKNIKEGQYIISISAMSFKETFIPVSDREFELGEIILAERSKELQQVTIVSKKPLIEQKVDRLVVNVQDNLAFSGGTALEVLSRSPGVTINAEKGLIALNGKSDVAVMINGKTSRMPLDALILMLNGMPAQNIQKIELITNPGAKYDASAAGGIINIVMVTDKGEGLNGTASLIGGYGGKERLGSTLGLSYKEKKLNAYSDLAYYRNHNKQLYTIDREIYNQAKTFADSLLSYRDPLSNYFSGKMGIDYSFNKNTLAGGFVSGLLDRFILNADTYVKDTDPALNASYIHILNNEDNIWSNLTGNLYLNHKLTDKQSLNFDLTYLYYYNSNRLTYANNYYNAQNSFIYKGDIIASNKAPINSWVGKIDYTYQITPATLFEGGAKGLISEYKSNIVVDTLENGVFVPNGSLTQVFELTEKVGAIYGNLNTRIGKKTQLISGLRYEYFYLNTQSLAGQLTRRSSDLYPSIYLSHQASEKSTFQLSYNRRVSRPAYNDFAPYFTFLDPTTSFTGNARLTQAISDAYKFDYKYIDKYIGSFQYTHTDNAIVRFQPQADLSSNSLFYSSINLRYQDVYALTFSIPVRLNSWWTMQNNILGIRQISRTQHLKDNITLVNNSIELNSSQTIKFPYNLSLTISGSFHTPQLYGFSRTRAYGNMDAGLEEKINVKSKLRFSVNNLIGKAKDWDIITDKAFNFNLYARYDYAPVIFRITYTRNFGSERTESGRKKSAGAEDIEGRIR